MSTESPYILLYIGNIFGNMGVSQNNMPSRDVALRGMFRGYVPGSASGCVWHLSLQLERQNEGSVSEAASGLSPKSNIPAVLEVGHTKKNTNPHYGLTDKFLHKLFSFP